MPLYKIFHKAGSSCACACVLGGERSTGIILNFPFEVLHNSLNKTGCKKHNVSVTIITKLMSANLSILTSTNFKNPNLSKANDKVF